MTTSDPFARRVLEGLRDRGMTLRELCRAIRLDPSFLSKVLSGKRSPPSAEAVLREIARALGLDEVMLIVSAGRIPSEWNALNDDPDLLRDVHGRATRGPAPASSRPSRAPRPTSPASPLLEKAWGSGDLAEELL